MYQNEMFQHSLFITLQSTTKKIDVLNNISFCCYSTTTKMSRKPTTKEDAINEINRINRTVYPSDGDEWDDRVYMEDYAMRAHCQAFLNFADNVKTKVDDVWPNGADASKCVYQPGIRSYYPHR